MTWTIGIDVGGTFTDFAAVDTASGRTLAHKEPTDPAEPARAVAAGAAALLARAGIAPDAVASVRHGTTLGLNALLERKGARAALVVTRGFGDMLELGRGDLPNPYSYKAPKPVAPIARERVIEIGARLAPDGAVRAWPDTGEIEAAAARIAALRVEAVALSLVNGYADPAREAELAQALAARLPGTLVTSAASLWPEVREYERTLVAVLNALIHPRLDAYYGALAAALAVVGLTAPLFITTSTGGCVSAASARARPIETVLSGPASGAFGAARAAHAAGATQAIALDMGGTSSDISIARDGRAGTTTETRLGDFPLMLPAADIWAIGAGGGSVAWVDEGVLKVGPRSAGADPGPACYARGGAEPTLTDCDLVSGFLNPGFFLGGRMALDEGAARRALEAVGARIGFAGEDVAARTAEAALRVATARMAASLANGLARRGLDPRKLALIAYGGAGPVHAAALAEAVGMAEIVVPASPGTFCALGAATAAIRRDFVHARRIRIGVDDAAGGAIATAAAAMEREARAWLADEGVAAAPELAVSADLQYPRTAAVLPVAIPERVWREGDAAAVAELFHQGHELAYGFRDGASAVDVTALRLSISAAPPAPPEAGARGGYAPAGARRVLWRGRWTQASVWRPGGGVTVLAGPALIEQDDTTVWVAPGWTARTDKAFTRLRQETP